MSGRGDRPVAPGAARMHAPPGLSGYASGQPDLRIPKRTYPTLDEQGRPAGRPYSQLSSIGYVESCSNPSAVISTCSSSLTASRPPAGAASASTHITMPSLNTPS